MQRTSRCLVLGLVLGLGMTSAPGHAADAGIFTLVEGAARVLREAKWYKLAPGARIQEGDIVDAGDKAQVQIELAKGGALNLVGPATLFAAAIPFRNDKFTGTPEFALPRGWLKIVAKTADAGVRVRAPGAVLNLQDGIAVLHIEPNSMEMFVEAGALRVTETGAGGKEGAAHDAKAGEYWARSADRPFATEHRAPPPFVAAMPRHFIDPLPGIAVKYEGARVQLVAEQDVTYAEAAPWLLGPYRRSFLRRFGPRLQDREFRSAVEANIARYPEWDRVLHPEKYLPKSPVPTN